MHSNLPLVLGSRFARLALVAGIMAMATPAVTLATGTLDQVQATFGGSRALIGSGENGEDVRQAQLFMAGITGNLDQVDLPIRVVGDPGRPLLVEIRALDGFGLPGAVLGSLAIGQGAVPACNTAACVDTRPGSDFTTFSFVSVPVSPPVPVTAGTQYVIVLSATGANLDIYGDQVGRTVNRYEWAGVDNEDVYGLGAGLSSVGSGWINTNADRAFKTYVTSPAPPYSGSVGQPINADGSSRFKAGKGVIPVRFTLLMNGTPTCSLPVATISLTKIGGTDPGPINESTYLQAADTGSSFRVSDCAYIYNLNAKGLSAGTYRVEISIGDQIVGSGGFELS